MSVTIRFTKDEDTKEVVLRALKNNEGYCPCKIDRIPENKCMCKEFREQLEGECHCGLYVKERKEN